MQLPERHAPVIVRLKTLVTFPPMITRVATAPPPAGSVWFAWFKDAVGPPLTMGRTDTVRLTAPEKPLTAVRVKFSRSWLLGRVVTLLHEQTNETSKSGNTVNNRFAALERVPFEPATVTV